MIVCTQGRYTSHRHFLFYQSFKVKSALLGEFSCSHTEPCKPAGTFTVREKLSKGEKEIGSRPDYFSSWIIKHVPQIRTNFCLMILSSACSWRIKIFASAGRVSGDNIFVLKLQRAWHEELEKRLGGRRVLEPDAKWKRRARTVAILYPPHAQLEYYLERAVNPEQKSCDQTRGKSGTQEVRALVDSAIFPCAEGIIYASARKEQHERGVNSQWALGRRS